MGVSMNKKSDFQREYQDVVGNLGELSPQQLDFNCRRAGCISVLISAGMLKYDVFDTIMTAMKHDSVTIDHTMIFITGFMFTAGIIFLYGGRWASRLLNIDKRTGRLPVGGWILSAFAIGGGVFLDLFVREAVRVCLTGGFIF